MQTIGKVKRQHHIHKMSIRKISKELDLSRNTVRKILRTDCEEERSYQRTEQHYPKLGTFIARLEELLTDELKLVSSKRRTARQLGLALAHEGYTGGYDSVRRFVKRWYKLKSKSLKQAFIPLVFAPGEAYQFDWSQETVELAGLIETVQVAHFRLSHSRKPFVMAYQRQSLEMVLDAHNQAFSFFGGLCQRGIYDNMKTAVDKVLRGKERIFNRRFLAMCNHFMIEPTTCTPAAAWEKGQVENQVGNLRERFFTPRLQFKNIDELNTYLRSLCESYAEQALHPGDKTKTIAEVFAQERAHLRELPNSFNAYNETETRVSSLCLVAYDRNHYSVEGHYAGHQVTLRAFATHIHVLADGKIIAEHSRTFGRGTNVYNFLHYLSILKHKPGALRNGAPFQDECLPKALAQVRHRLIKQPQGTRELIEILSLIPTEGIEIVLVACELALEQGTVSASVIINLVYRLKHPLPPEPLAVPENLILRHPPIADCQRYDRLRQSVS